MFYGIVGKDVYENDSASFYNPIEASKVLELVQSLLRKTDAPTQADVPTDPSTQPLPRTHLAGHLLFVCFHLMFSPPISMSP
jgi:hypothetical protein